MKKNIKGVTLIALVVTIIVLLILGTVSIRLVTKHQVIDITAKVYYRSNSNLWAIKRRKTSTRDVRKRRWQI